MGRLIVGVVAAGVLRVIRGLIGDRPSSHWNLSPNHSGDDSTLGRDAHCIASLGLRGTACRGAGKARRLLVVLG